MPKIHVIYDPQDRITTHGPEVLEKLGVKIAVLSISDESFANIGATAETLTCMLLDEIKKED